MRKKKKKFKLVKDMIFMDKFEKFGFEWKGKV